MQNKQADPGTDVDIHKALADLEDSLMNSVSEMTPAIDSIAKELGRAAFKIRTEGDASILWSCLDSLQKFLQLLETVTVTAGISPNDIAVFDTSLSQGLQDLEFKMGKATNAEEVACAVETSLLPALDTWGECEIIVREGLKPQQ